MKIPEQLRVSLVLIFLAFLFFLMIKYFFPLITPFLLGLVIAYLIESPVAFLEKRFRCPRELAVFAVLFFAVLITGFLLTLLFAHLYQEIKELLIVFPSKVAFLGEKLERLITDLENRFQLGFGVSNKISPERLFALVRGLLQEALILLKGFPSFLLNLFLSGLVAFFISRDKERISAFFLSLFPFEWQKPLLKIHNEVILAGLEFLKIQTILAVITGLFSTLFLGVFGFAHPWLIGIILGLLDFFPLIGPSALYFPWIGWQIASGQIGTALFLLLIFLITLGFRQLAEVKLIGGKLGLHPLAALFTVYLGIKLFGIYGFLCGPIFFVMLRSLYYGVIPFLQEDDFRL